MPKGKTTEAIEERAAKGLPGVRAVVCSDLHLCARAPVARSGEEDWFEAMARPLRELWNLSESYSCPILYAGDIFDRWNAGPEVINFAIQNLPQGYAVPGQHDLPNHNYGDIKRSAYWTLVEAGILRNLEPGRHVIVDGVLVTGFPWGFPPVPLPESIDGILNIAVIHRFIYTKGTGYTGVNTDYRASASRTSLVGFNVAAYGDNHKGFIEAKDGLTICNCGGFMRRKSDERDYRPGVGLVMDDGTVERHYFDTTAESFIELTQGEEEVGKLLDMSAFAQALAELGSNDALNFEVAVRRFLDTNKTEKRVRDIVLRAVAGE